ncbi:hypothetical protein [Haloarcula salina]|uniref:Uncharacterized protein n=1 Tax=Haloarcula salina TaxID=1429914 RepID=A0AA41KEL4_9EURY|nr:hypothetical protein [Haloarcula salina]MBV0901032.1 hypothetical protein [Haloarcula salina]
MAASRDGTVRDLGSVGMLGGALLTVYGLPDLLVPIAFSVTSGTARLYGLLLLPPLCCLVAGHVALRAARSDELGRVARTALRGSELGTAVAAVGVAAYFGLSIGTVAGVTDAAFLCVVLGLTGALCCSCAFGAARLWTAGALTPEAALCAAPLVTAFALAVSLATPLPIRFAALSVPYGVAWTLVGYHLFDSGRPHARREADALRTRRKSSGR